MPASRPTSPWILGKSWAVRAAEVRVGGSEEPSRRRTDAGSWGSDAGDRSRLGTGGGRRRGVAADSGQGGSKGRRGKKTKGDRIVFSLKRGVRMCGRVGPTWVRVRVR
jgi:hypothetical protein